LVSPHLVLDGELAAQGREIDGNVNSLFVVVGGLDGLGYRGAQNGRRAAVVELCTYKVD